jgi:hypothetical protein
MKRKSKTSSKALHIPTSNLLMLVWIDAAAKWRKLPSEPNVAKCRAARYAYYLAMLGTVPPLPTGTEQGQWPEI